ncbi:MAG: hypothetical protein CSA81_13150 [Acidobacteria bacterium]|nr:MAG: hypothetical protein CSA81_13150 [Acidobacteriota bacterium]PIE89164.1 MAG: hypothetical protein CR997_12885 [Acidobacteriota bacterium]
MNHYRKKNYYRKRNFSNRNNRRYKDTYHQPKEQTTDSLTPHSLHTLTKGDVEAVVESMLSGTLSQGKELERFESLLAKLTHCHYALAVNSGTAAIHTALAAIGIEEGDEVITSTLNFCAVANMTRMMGGVPVLVDCDPETLTLSVEEAGKVITPRTKAIFANNFAGQPSDMFALRELCDEHSIFLLEDACHGLGGRYRGHYTGNQADMTCFSFQPSKAITSGEGGAVTTNDVDRFAFMKLFRHHGIQKDPDYFQSEDVHAGYHQEVQFQGMNYKMSELQAALGRNQLTRLDRHLERRRAIAQVYQTNLAEVEGVILPQSAEWADHAFHLYPIQLTGPFFGKRDAIFDDFYSNGIAVQVHYVPIHLMPLYREENEEKNFPNAETYYKNCISLPIYPDLGIKEIDRIVDVLKKSLESHKDVDFIQDMFKEEVEGQEDQLEVAEKAKEETPTKTRGRKKTTPYRRRTRKKDPEVTEAAEEPKAAEELKPAEEPKSESEPQKKEKPVEPVPVEEVQAADPLEPAAEETEKKPKRRPPARKNVTRTRKTKKKTAEKEEPASEQKAPTEEKPQEESVSAEKSPVEEAPAEEVKTKPAPKRKVTRKKPTKAAEKKAEDTTEETVEKPKAKTTRKRKTAETTTRKPRATRARKAAEPKEKKAEKPVEPTEEKPKKVTRTRKKKAKTEPTPAPETPKAEEKQDE